MDAELKAAERAFGGATKLKPGDVQISEEDWSALIAHLAEALKGESDSDLPDFSGAQCNALRSRIAQARRAIRYARKLSAPGVDPPTTVLLPAGHAGLLERLLGRGELPIVWLYPLDVARF